MDQFDGWTDTDFDSFDCWHNGLDFFDALD